MEDTLLATATANCTITNNAGVDVVVLDEFATASKQQMYEQSLTLLSDGKPVVIKANSPGTVALDETHTDDKGATQSYLIHGLMIAKADNLYPVKAASGMINSTANTFPAQAVSADDYKNMQLAGQFQQAITAYPTSDLAKGYINALTASTASPTTTTSIATAVNSFFAGRNEYKTLTLDKVVAVQTYYSQFPFVWVDFKASKTYYLYSSDGASVKYMGSVTLTAPSSIPANPDKSLPGFKITYTNASNNTQNLYYTNSAFVDNVNLDIPNICLKGLFALRSDLSKKPDDNTVISILSGSVNGATVLGYDEKQPQSDQDKWSGLYILLHPKDAMDWLSLFMTFMGIVMGIEVMGKGVNWLKDKIQGKKDANGGKDPAQSEVDGLKSQLTEIKTQMVADNQRILDQMRSGQKVAEDLNKNIDELQQKLKDRMNEDQRSALQDNLAKDEAVLEDVAQYQVDDKLEEMAGTLETQEHKINDASTEELSTVAPEVQVDVSRLNTDIKSEVEEVSASVDENVQREFEQAKTDIKTAEETSEKIKESSDNVKEGGDARENTEFEARPELEL